jgi:hypothetical protein
MKELSHWFLKYSIVIQRSHCSLGLSATSQQYFSLSNQPAVLFSQNKPAPAISHQPTEQAVYYLQNCTY